MANSWANRGGGLRGTFTRLIGTKSVPSDPSRNWNPNGTPHIQTSTYGMAVGLAPVPVPYTLNGPLLGGGGLPNESGFLSFDVTNNTFDGLVIIKVGEQEFVRGVDWIEGATAALTAVAIIAAINAAPGLHARLEGTVTVEAFNDRPISLTRFEISHYGVQVNFTNVETENGAAPEAVPGSGGPYVHGFMGMSGGSKQIGNPTGSGLLGPSLT